MKKLSVIVVLSILFLIQATAFAQIRSDALVWTLNLGLVSLSDSETGSDITGRSFNTTLEKYIGNTAGSIGVNLGFNSGEDVIVIGANVKSYNTLSSTTFLFTGKYSFLKSNNIIPYIGLGIGWAWQTKETAIVDLGSAYYIETSLSGFTATVPVGVNFYIDNMVFLGANIAPFYAENSYYKDDINWAANFSLGFQF